MKYTPSHLWTFFSFWFCIFYWCVLEPMTTPCLHLLPTRSQTSRTLLSYAQVSFPLMTNASKVRYLLLWPDLGPCPFPATYWLSCLIALFRWSRATFLWEHTFTTLTMSSPPSPSTWPGTQSLPPGMLSPMHWMSLAFYNSTQLECHSFGDTFLIPQLSQVL